ncbi:hypothetical protein JSO63_02835 [Riemerella anatipestifer]|uniref:hypothetical protein n=1 Tax=Riemerella anatipestifer TaxID=34085 RepID=UPI0007EDF547|nr:hypothetical protein [Riemerella anatipestifer]UXN81039.1 hypothetical protein [Phage vB_RanS_PJN03]MCD5969573.1 hypothetical protein [Riemerella anatipestifer]MDY3344432.1 hypothetical protein [Riemerella anatipestifer]MDY3357512.1 hypothetical protein [Riemerella anatipestifer]MDY3507024.1 hypothetical protein [Riemerella anatipestifer]
MELKDFIKETLVQINNGVKEAQEECLKSNGLINPMLDIPLSNEEKFNVDGKYYPATKVEFEIGLTEIDKEANKLGIGVFLPKIGIGGQTENAKNLQSTTNIRFSITAVFPYINREGKHIPLSSISII